MQQRLRRPCGFVPFANAGITHARRRVQRPLQVRHVSVHHDVLQPALHVAAMSMSCVGAAAYAAIGL
jgi:hypothetical protein